MSTDRPRQRCQQCGRTHRSDKGLCYTCRTGHVYHQTAYAKAALTGGEWVRRGAIWHWQGDETSAEPRTHHAAPTCDKCRSVLRRDNGCPNCALPPLVFPGRPVCDCGCLLAFPGEDCPNCRAQLLEVAA